jgi:H+/Cl- antiporter ClcA
VCERKSDAVVSIAVAAAGIVAGTWRAPMGATVLVFSVGDHNARRPPRTRIHSSSAD